MATLTQEISSLDELKKLMKKRGKTTQKRSTQGWATVGKQKIYARSEMERRYATFLEFMKSKSQIRSWKHEPKEFWFLKIRRGVRSYKPDFKVVTREGQVEYHEVKGWMDRKSKTKLKRMAKYYPNVVVKVIDANWFKKNAPLISGLVEGWER
jgi:hypothetical protein